MSISYLQVSISLSGAFLFLSQLHFIFDLPKVTILFWITKCLTKNRKMGKIMVTGATGQLGTLVINLLVQKMNPENISVLVRDTAKAEGIKEKGITISKGDYNDYNSLLSAFKGIDKLYFISSSDLNDREKHHENVIKAAVESKVKHVIYTGFQRKNETATSPIAFIAKAHLTTEKLLKESGIAYTILNHGLYAEFIQNILGEQFSKSATIFFPAGKGKVAFTLRSDLAEGGVKILTTTGHENKIYDFFAERRYCFDDLVTIFSKLLGKPVSYISPEKEEYKATLLKAGVPEMYVNLFAGFAEAIKQGEFDASDNTLTKMLGRECVGVEEFFRQVYKN
jgi:NAD(P)H dehydrogenase (quinone)